MEHVIEVLKKMQGANEIGERLKEVISKLGFYEMFGGIEMETLNSEKKENFIQFFEIEKVNGDMRGKLVKFGNGTNNDRDEATKTRWKNQRYEKKDIGRIIEDKNSSVQY